MAFVSLTFDDALPEHLDYVAPLLDANGFPGTFYVHLSSPVLNQRNDEWRELARAGHELGNHTIFHPAEERKSWVTEANAIEYYSLQRMKSELQTANDWLHMLDGRTARSFAYPCSNPIIGRPGLFRRMITGTRLERTRVATWLNRFSGPGDSRIDYRSLACELFTACRGGGLTLESEIPPTDQLDRSMLPSVSVEGQPLERIKTFIKKGLADGRWPILQFHGVGGSHGQNCDPVVFAELICWLAAENIMVETISQGARGLPHRAVAAADTIHTESPSTNESSKKNTGRQGSHV